MSKTTFTTNLIVATLLLSLASIFTLRTAQATAVADVSEIGDYVQLYQHTFPANANYDTTTSTISYAVDNSGTLVLPLGFTRVGYYLEIDNGSGRQWVWASMDAFSTTLTDLGIPMPGSGVTHQQIVTNMNVESNLGGIVTGTLLQTGNIEMWSSNYGTANGIGIPNASVTAFDFGDSGAANTDGYGSFQIHNHDLDGSGPDTVGQTLFAYNGWGAPNVDDLGIGTQPTLNPDWTFAANVGTYSLRSLEIFVLPVPPPVPEPSSFFMLGLGALGIVRHTRRRRVAA